MHWFKPSIDGRPFHLNRICDPPSSHGWKLGFTNHSQNIVITRLLRKSCLLVAFTLVLSHSAYWIYYYGIPMNRCWKNK